MGRGWGHRNGHEKHLVFSENRFQSGRRVGFTTGVCTVASSAPDRLPVPGHRPHRRRPADRPRAALDQPSNVFAITGRTGRWRNAGRQAVSRDISPTRSELTLYISDLG
jgi:hypothetical protein